MKNRNFIRIGLADGDIVILNVNYIVQVVPYDNDTCEITLNIGNGNVEFLKVNHPFGYMMNLLGC